MRIAITGMGIVSALGIGKEITKKTLLNETIGIGSPCFFGTSCADYPVGEVKFSNAKLGEEVNCSHYELFPRSTLLGAIACREALKESLVNREDNFFNVGDMAFVNGTTVGGMDLTEKRWKDRTFYGNEIAKTHSVHACTRQIATFLGNFKYVASVSTACSSSLNAVLFACNLVRSGKFKRVLAGGCECLTLFHFNGFRSLKILSKDLCAPFCLSHNGLNLGEGAAYVVVESEETAKNRKAPILCYIGGYANSCDAYHQTASSENGIGSFLAMDNALSMAKVNLHSVDYIHTHGTATENNDNSEGNAIVSLCQKYQKETIELTSTKTFTGHTTSASGSISLVISILGMQSDIIPAHLPDTSPMNKNTIPLFHNVCRKQNMVLCNSFGFGGNDSSILISRNAIDLPDMRSEVNVVIEADDIFQRDRQYDNFLSSSQSRRMIPDMKHLVAVANQVLRFGFPCQVDAIVTGTAYGCISNTIQLLDTLTQEGENAMSPSLFMQSTHNTPSSQLGILFQNRGYNSTYSSDMQSYEVAMLDASLQIQVGNASKVLVLSYDEDNMLWEGIISGYVHEYKPTIRATLLSRYD